MEFKKIRYEKKDHIVIITLNRPEVHNCLSQETALELHHAWQDFRDDDDAFVAIMTGAGEKAFSICELPQGAIRADKETVMRSWGRPISEGLFIEEEMASSMLMRQDKHSEGASAFKEKRKPDWKHHGL